MSTAVLEHKPRIRRSPPATFTERVESPPDHVTVSLDREKMVLRVERAGRPLEETTQVRLRKVTFVVKEGVRRGCAETGWLGFVEGDLEPYDGDLPNAQIIRFNGRYFLREDCSAIMAANEVVISGGRIYAR